MARAKVEQKQLEIDGSALGGDPPGSCVSWSQGEKRMAGTTRLELLTSAVAVQRFDVIA